MSDKQPSAPQQGKRRKEGGGRESFRGGGREKVHLHAVTDEQAVLLRDTENARPLEEVKKKTGAELHFDPNPSPVPGMKILIIRGVPYQIEAVIRLVRQMTGSQATLAEEVQIFWLQWTKAAYPDLESRAYFLPPVYFNRVPMTTETIAGQDVQVLLSPPSKVGKGKSLVERFGCFSTSVKKHEERDEDSLHSNHRVTSPPATAASFISQPAAVQDSDIRYDAAMRQVLFCLQSLSENTGEVLVGITKLHFRQYLSEPCFAVAAAQLPRASSLPPDLPQNWKQGNFDVLLIHRHFGLVVCNVISFGEFTEKLPISQDNTGNILRKKLRDAVSQLNKAEAMLSHLVSDIAPGLRITKTIAVPNLTTDQLQQAISHDSQLTEDLHCCLKTTDPADIADVCLCCDQLCDPKTPCDVSSHVLKKLGEWWTRCVTVSGRDCHMTRHVYRTLVARFCGPATTVSVPCTCPPRVSVKTLGQAVWWTGECYTAVITLFPEQVHLLHTAPRRLFVTGPPGTGKTVVLVLKGEEWLRCGEDVYLVSTWLGGRASSLLMNHLLATYVSTQKSAGKPAGQLRLLHYDFSGGKDVEKALQELSEAARGDKLYVIADEAGPDSWYFEDFCAELLNRVPQLRLWAASCFARQAPADWMVEHLTRPLRSPPTVVREVQKDRMFTRRVVQPYSERGVPDHTEGPPVKELYHRRTGHSGQRPVDCITCGNEVASVLKQLDVNVRGNISGRAPPDLQWRDVLVLVWGGVRPDSGIVTGMSQKDIPVRVMEDEDIEDMATARSDVVWVADGHLVQGLERKVVVCVLFGVDLNVRLYSMSRCTSQLVVVSPD